MTAFVKIVAKLMAHPVDGRKDWQVLFQVCVQWMGLRPVLPLKTGLCKPLMCTLLFHGSRSFF
jgi:hypothetical protein